MSIWLHQGTSKGLSSTTIDDTAQKLQNSLRSLKIWPKAHRTCWSSTQKTPTKSATKLARNNTVAVQRQSKHGTICWSTDGVMDGKWREGVKMQEARLKRGQQPRCRVQKSKVLKQFQAFLVIRTARHWYQTIRKIRLPISVLWWPYSP